MTTRPLFEFISRYKIHLLLLLGLIVGLFYVFLVPPWMHYDEPGHFEYAWLAANQETWPVEGDYDQYMRREVVASMMEHRFQDYTGVKLPITSIYEPVKLLISQLGDKPLYYFLVSLPLRLVKFTDITFQLYTARLVSLSMFLVTVWISWKVTSLLFGPKHPMSWMVPTALIGIPGFVDLITAVNNDALAILGFSAFVWASVLLLQRGFSPLRLLFLIFSVLVCYYAKSTAWLAIPLSLFVLPFSIVRGKQQKFVWIGLGLFLVLTIALGIDWGKTVPAYYVVTGQQQNLLRVTDEGASSGQFVLEHKGDIFFQPLTREGLRELPGKPVIFTAWIWAEKETDIQFPEIGILDKPKVVLSDEKIHITTEPMQYSSSVQMPKGEYFAWLSFFGSGDNKVYWDDIVLTTYPLEEGGSKDHQVNNYVRNSTMDLGTPKFSELLDQLFAKADVKISISQIEQLFDYDSIWWYLQTMVTVFFKTFWGSFGWGAVPLIGKFPYQILLILSVVSGLVSLYYLIKKTILLPKPVSFLFLIIVTSQIISAFARGAGSWYSYRYYPTARYFYPVIIPLVMYFVHGIYRMLNLSRFIINSIGTNANDLQSGIVTIAHNMIYFLSVVLLIAWGVISIYSYYI